MRKGLTLKTLRINRQDYKKFKEGHDRIFSKICEGCGESMGRPGQVVFQMGERKLCGDCYDQARLHRRG